MAPHSSTLAWKIPWTEKPGRLQSMGLPRVGHDSVTSLSLFTYIPRRADRSYSTFKVRRGGSEEIPLVQGKRNPSKMVGVARGIRGQTYKP